MAYLTIRIKNTDGHTFQDLDKDRLVLGRSSRTEIPIKHTSISREHCVFVREEDGTWYVEDLGSSNGTWVNRDKVQGRKALVERDIVKAGQTRITFHAGERQAVAAGEEDALDVDLGDDDAPRGPNRIAGENDPPEAIPCGHCGAWFSIAHRLAGDEMACPKCEKSNTVPNMVMA
jgi:hypothetical protein